MFRTEAELEERHNSGKSQDEKSDVARSYSGERAQAMSNQSSEGPRQ